MSFCSQIPDRKTDDGKCVICGATRLCFTHSLMKRKRRPLKELDNGFYPIQRGL